MKFLVGMSASLTTFAIFAIASSEQRMGLAAAAIGWLAGVFERVRLRGRWARERLTGFSLDRLAIVAIAFSVVLRLVNLGSRELWYDEVLSLLLSTGQKIAYQSPNDVPVILSNYTAVLSLPDEATARDVLKTTVNLLRGIVGGEPHPPLFFLLQHIWLRLFGSAEAAMRSLGALLSVGAIASAYGLGRIILGHRGGLLFAALLGTNPFYLFHSLNLRMYGPLVLWTILSAWALLELIEGSSCKGGAPGRAPTLQGDSRPAPARGKMASHFNSLTIQLSHLAASPMTWNVALIGAVAAGLLTFYLFIYWIVALLAVALYLDRQRWWQHGLRLGGGAVLSIPWGVWGIPQQLRNADFERFAAPTTALAAGIERAQDVAETLGIHLVLGDWVTSLPEAIALLTGCAAIAAIVAASLCLWRRGEQRLLGLAWLLGIFPLVLALLADIASGKFTVGFGWGRSMIFILPGCLLLLTVWVERARSPGRQWMAAALLLLYLSTSAADWSVRSRQVFHQIAAVVAQEPATPTLIAMNSKAWGHVLRLAYYIPASAKVSLLAGESERLIPALERFLKAGDRRYARIVWLETAAPVWSAPATNTQRQQIQRVLQSRFRLAQQQSLSGTMDLDDFTLRLYQPFSAN